MSRIQTLEAPADHPVSRARQWLEPAVERAGELLLGKDDAVRLALACCLARGHLLIEDLPGVGKTLLAHVLARVLGLGFRRVQFTSDLLPSDILGVSVYDRRAGGFAFHPGPIFSQVLLADEVNRATPKTQSALLEAMEEAQVSVEGETRPLPTPFFVVATQNPSCQVGTFPLPESQLDRFLMRLHLGYPDPVAERALLVGRDRRDLLEELQPCATPEQLLAAHRAVEAVHVSAPLLDYVQELLGFTRRDPGFRHGLSPRAGLSLLRGARAWALLEGREFVLPDDVRRVLPAVVGHRLVPVEEGDAAAAVLLARLLNEVAVP
ncbi:MAG TPA: MoxR family ATPase [Deferrisomatales bacterium]|nr:MoxR family ATPase [Deferrisomatales bacterium]